MLGGGFGQPGGGAGMRGGRPPSEHIVEALLQRFVPLARARIDAAAQDGQGLKLEDGAYEKVLDSLAMVAAHMPRPLLDALLKWREGESPKLMDDAKFGPGQGMHTLHRKLLVECVFISAAVRFVDCCPLDGLTEELWSGLEDFIFDWFVHAERLIPQSEFPGLMELRAKLLDYVADLAGVLSVKRFESMAARFFVELDTRAMEQPMRLEGLSATGSLRVVPVVDVFARGSERSLAMEFSVRRYDATSNRNELLSVVHGMRFLRLDMSTPAAVMASRNFLLKANPLSRAPSKKKTELQHTLCAMLTSILAPLTENPRSRWPPLKHLMGGAGGGGVGGVGPAGSAAAADALTAWNSAVLHLRGQLSGWVAPQSTLSLQMDKQSRHIQVAYPLNTLLLCLGDQHSFDSLFNSFVEMLYKHLREKSYRAVALDCLHRLVHFYLSVYADGQPKSRVWEKLEGITKQLMTSLKKGVLSQDMQHDRLVDLCVTVAATDLEFAMNHMVIELLRTDGLGEAKVVGLRALLAVVENALHQSNAATLMAPDRKSSALAGSAKPLGTTRQAPHVPFFGGPGGGGGGGGGLPPGLPAPQMSQQQQMLMQQQKQQQLQKQQGAGAAGHAAHLSSRFGSVDYGRLGVGPAETAVMAPHMPRVRAALGAIIKQCHAAFGSLLLITPKTTIDMMSKDKVQSWQVFKWALRCMPHLIPEQWRNDKMTEIIPVYAISIDPHVRDEAVQVLFRTVRDLPQCRFPILRGMANFILKIPDEYPHLIHSSLVCLVQLLNAWRICLAYEASSSAAASGHGPGGPLAGAGAGGGAAGGPGGADLLARTRQVLAAHGGDDGLRFDPSGMDAVGLIFLCSADNKIRRTALELLRNVRALQRDLARLFAAGGEQQVEEDPPTTYIIDIMEETGEEVVSKCYWDSGKWHELQPESDAEALQDVTLQHILEGSDQARWGRCLSELVKYCAELCPSSVQGARLEVVARMTPLSPADSSAKAGAGGDGDTKLEQWQLYAMFACACPPEDAPDGGEQSIKELVRLVLPMARSGAESSVYAATVALGHAHAGICEAMLTELMMWVEELLAEIEQRKWKNQKVRKEDMRVFMAQVYRLVAENLWPGVLPQRPWLRQLFLKFMDSTAQHVSKETGDAFLDAQPLRFALCSVVRCLSIELNGCASKRFDIKLRRQLFDLMASWCDEAGGLESMTSEFRREVERTKAAAMARTKDAAERSAVEKELNEQADAIHGMAMQALAALLHGPCFDEGLRKMSGKAVTWIRSLMESAAGTGQAAAGMGGMGMGMGMGMMGMGMGMGMMGMGMGMGGSPRDVFNRRKGGEGGHGKGVGNREWRSLFGSPSWRSMLGREALLNLLKTNPDIVPAIIDQCYNSDSELANGYFTVLAEVYMREECPQCELHRLLSLILYKVVDPCRSIRDDALQMLETMSMRDWADYTSSYSSSAGRYRAAVVGSLPDSYQQFQFQLSAKLAHEHPEMSELLCEEIMQRQLDAVNIIAQHQVLTCMAPWIENLNFAALWDSGWSERLLKSLYYVTWRHGDQFPDEIEKLWSTVAAKRRNIIPVINFLISKGLEDCDSAGGEITGALETYFSVAKRISLYLARISPQQTIDHLVYELSQRMSEEDAVDVSSSADQWQEDMSEILRFSHGCKL
ncbi:unnamed protein product, partial [Closterium sp. NIES-64]